MGPYLNAIRLESALNELVSSTRAAEVSLNNGFKQAVKQTQSQVDNSKTKSGAKNSDDGKTMTMIFERAMDAGVAFTKIDSANLANKLEAVETPFIVANFFEKSDAANLSVVTSVQAIGNKFQDHPLRQSQGRAERALKQGNGGL